MLLAAMPVTAAPIRVATFNADMSRQGPGLLLRDILSGTDAQTIAVVDVISRIAPDILLLNGFDWLRAGIFVLIALAAFGLAAWMFERRDIFAGERGWSLPRFRRHARAEDLDASTSHARPRGHDQTGNAPVR